MEGVRQQSFEKEVIVTGGVLCAPRALWMMVHGMVPHCPQMFAS